MPCEVAINHPDITDATRTLIKLANDQKLFVLNDDYSKIPSSDGRVMFS